MPEIRFHASWFDVAFEVKTKTRTLATVVETDGSERHYVNGAHVEKLPGQLRNARKLALAVERCKPAALRYLNDKDRVAGPFHDLMAAVAKENS